MRNLSKLVFQRVVAVSVGILLQIGFLIVMATYLRADFFWIRIAMNVLSWAMVIYIISCGVNPSYKIAWIVLILAFPVAGLTIYLLFGGNKISSYEHRKMQSIEAVTMQQLQQEEEPLWELAAARTPAFNHARYLLSASGYPIYDDADATYFPSGESCYAAMLEELQKAEHYIFIEFFIIAQGKMWDPILQILREKAAAGVDVRVVYDDFGCITRLPMQYAKKLREMGIRAHAFNPYVPILSARLNNRDHRKLMLIDGKVGFTGGVNLADEYINEIERFGHWKDCGILVRGKAVGGQGSYGGAERFQRNGGNADARIGVFGQNRVHHRGHAALGEVLGDELRRASPRDNVDEVRLPLAAVTETHFQTAFQKINDLQIVVPVRRVAVAAVVDAVEKADADIPVCRNPFEIALHGALPFLVFSCIQTKRV